MGRYSLGLKMRLAYFDFKRRFVVIFSIWALAFIAGIGLIVASEFMFSNWIAKFAAVVLAILLFIRIFYDSHKALIQEYKDRFASMI